MSRVSQEELYNDKDVVTQILKLKDTVNDYAGGIIENIDVSGNDLVIDWANGESISLPLPNPTGISSVAGTVSGGNLTITFYMTDGSSHAFTCPLTGMATETYVDGLDAQNVKLTGAQSVAGVKTFTNSPEVPTTPATPTSAVNDVYVNDASDGVNNILHKSGREIVTSTKAFDDGASLILSNGVEFDITPPNNKDAAIFFATSAVYSSPSQAVIRQRTYTNRDRTLMIHSAGATPNGDDVDLYQGATMYFYSPYNDMANRRVTIVDQRSFGENNDSDIVTIGTLKQALRHYGLIP